MIEWLEQDKLDAPISIRWFGTDDYYVTQYYRTSSWTPTFTTWFRPKALLITGTFNDTVADNYRSISRSWTVEQDDWSLLTTCAYSNTWDRNSTDTWDSSTTKCVILWDNDSDENYWYVQSFNDDWFTLSLTEAFSDNRYLYITAMK